MLAVVLDLVSSDMVANECLGENAAVRTGCTGPTMGKKGRGGDGDPYALATGSQSDL